MKTTAICKTCTSHRNGSGCLYVLGNNSELCPRVKQEYENFRTGSSDNKVKNIRKSAESISRNLGNKFDDVAKAYEEFYVGDEK